MRDRTMRLVGRQAELTPITSAVAAVATSGDSPRVRVVSISDEAGIGKTRLAEEAAAVARERGFVVLAGTAYPLGTSIAYGPLLEALGNHLRALSDFERARLTSGLEELGRLFPGLVGARPEPVGDPALEKARLFDAADRFLARMAERRPVLLLLDDLHWADAATLELVQHLTRPAARRLLVLLVYRRDNAPPALRTLLTSLRRQSLVEIEPAGLLDSEVTEMLADLLDAMPPPGLAHAVASRAGGNPLFVQAQATLLLETGGLTRSGTHIRLDAAALSKIPPVVRDVVLDRLGRLSAEDRHVVDLLAVGADRVPHRLLAALTAAPDAALARLQSMRLVEEILLEEVGGGGIAYLLAHPLIQEVAYWELTELERRQLHAAYARALEGADTPAVGPDLDRLARHLRLARDRADPGRLIDVLRAAGERALALHAPREAAEHLQAAIEAIRAGRRTELLPPTLELLGDAWERVGEAEAAVTNWGEALASRRTAGERTAAGRLHSKLALAEWSQGDTDAARDHVRRALAAIEGLPGSPEHVDVHSARLQLAARTGDAAEAAAAAADLVTLAEAVGSPRLLAWAAIAETMAVMESDRPVAALAAAESAIEVATAAGDPVLVYQANDMGAVCALWLGDHRRAHLLAAECLDIARRLRAPPLQGRARAEMVLAAVHAGEWRQARQAAETWLEGLEQHSRFGPERTAAFQFLSLGLLAALTGEAGEAHGRLAEAARAFPGLERDLHLQQIVAATRVHACLAEGEAARGLEVPSPNTGDFTCLLDAGTGEAAAIAGRLDQALDAARILHRRADGTRTLPESWARWLEGLVALANGERETALADFAVAAEIAAEAENPFALARSRAAWGEVRAGAPGAAALLRALEAFDHLGARRHADRTRRALRVLGLAAPGRQSRRRSGPLTGREGEIAVLAAQGLTSAELAARLYISPQTVATHLKRIYARLGVGSRAALVRYALEAGWLGKYPERGTDTPVQDRHRAGS
ncbi:MAG TPA: AAA family ATPase [Candidatus Dormibacteraeota bacterium]|nr:AAA family ATPase [Candidatus Dormibacteraeota bacterium]